MRKDECKFMRSCSSFGNPSTLLWLGGTSSADIGEDGGVLYWFDFGDRAGEGGEEDGSDRFASKEDAPFVGVSFNCCCRHIFLNGLSRFAEALPGLWVESSPVVGSTDSSLSSGAATSLERSFWHSSCRPEHVSSTEPSFRFLQTGTSTPSACPEVICTCDFEILPKA